MGKRIESRRFLVVFGLALFSRVLPVEADQLPLIVLDESDHVCWNIFGSMDTIQECLLRAAEAKSEALDNRLNAIFKNILDNEKNISLEKMRKSMENNQNRTCDVLYYEQYKNGSLRRTEPIRCIYYVLDNKLNVLDFIYETIYIYDKPIMLTFFQDYHFICWNPNGWRNETECLQDNLILAEVNLRRWSGLIFGEDFESSGEDIDKAFRDAQETWREDVDLTCGGLMRLLHARKPNEEQMVIWCRYAMTRERERLLLRLYEFNLHQIDISVRN